MKNNVLKYYIATFCFCSTSILLAQPGDNDTGGTLEGSDPAPAIIDNYVWVIALVGFLFVFMKFRDLLKNKIQE